MSYAAALLTQCIRRVLYLQAALTVAVAAGFGLALIDTSSVAVPAWFNGLLPTHQVLSAGYGGAVAMLSTWWLGRRINQAGEIGRQFPGREPIALYAGLIQRLLGTVALLGIGFALLRLSPLPLVTAFAAAQLGLIAACKTTRVGR